MEPMTLWRSICALVYNFLSLYRSYSGVEWVGCSDRPTKFLRDIFPTFQLVEEAFERIMAGLHRGRMRHNVEGASGANMMFLLAHVPKKALRNYLERSVHPSEENMAELDPDVPSSRTVESSFWNVVYGHQWARTMGFWRRHCTSKSLSNNVLLLVNRLCEDNSEVPDHCLRYVKYVGQTSKTRSERQLMHETSKKGSGSCFMGLVTWLGDPDFSTDLWVGKQDLEYGSSKELEGRLLRLDAEAMWAELLRCSQADGTGANIQVIDVYVIVVVVCVLSHLVGRSSHCPMSPSCLVLLLEVMVLVLPS